MKESWDLSKVVVLDLSLCEISEIDLSGLSNLERLTLDYNRFENIQFLQERNQIEYLSLINNKINKLEGSNLLIEEINLERNPINLCKRYLEKVGNAFPNLNKLD